MLPTHSPIARRGFLFRLSQATAALTALAVNPARLAGATTGSPDLGEGADHDAWIGRLKGENKVMIHAHQHIMTALVDARTMVANAREAYGVPASQFSLAVVTHGPAIQGMFRDELWERRALGTHYKVNDPKTGVPATRNIYLTPQEGEPADAAVAELVNRGVTFVVCNVALKTLARRLAASSSGNADAIYEELAAGLAQGVYLVPDVFVSIQRAQKRGVAYIFTDRPR